MRRTANFLILKKVLAGNQIKNALMSAAVTGRPGLVLCLGIIVSSVFPIMYKSNDSVFTRTNIAVIILTTFFVAAYALFTAGILKNKLSMHRSVRLFYLSIPAVLLIVFVSVLIRTNQNIRLAEEFEGKYSTIVGTVETMPVTASQPDGKNDRNNSWTAIDFKAENGMKIRLIGPADKLRYKSKIRITGFFVRPEKESNPGCFSYYDYLAGKEIYLTCSISSRENIELLEKPAFWQPDYWSYAVREQLGNSLLENLGSEENALLKSLVLGDDRKLDQKLKIQFRRAGLSHLTAVSGTHVAFLQIPAAAFAALFSFRRRQKAVFLSAIMLLYGFVTGWHTGTVRAVLMAISVLWTRYRNKSGDSLNTLGFAGAIIVILDYNSVRQTGFWLSFSAVAALAGFSGQLSVWIEKLVSKVFHCPDDSKIIVSISRALSAVLVIQIVLAPISSIMSGEVFLLAWLINIPAMLLAALICTLAIFSWPLITLLEILAKAFVSENVSMLEEIFKTVSARTLYSPIRIMKLLAEKTSLVSFGRFPAEDINSYFWIGANLIVIWFWLSCIIPACKRKKLSEHSCRSPDKISQSKTEKSRIYKHNIVFICGVVFLIAGMILHSINYMSRPEWRIYFLDVGQGDAILMHHKSGKTILIDGGPKGSGYYVILPVMTRLGIDRIDLTVLTHGHEDHAAGLIELCEMGLIKSIAFNLTTQYYLQNQMEDGVYEHHGMLYTSEDSDEDTSFASRDITTDLLETVLRKPVDTTFWAKGDRILFDDTEFTVLSPQRNMTFEQSVNNANDSSIVLSFQWQSYSILFLADISEKIENGMHDQWPAADVIKVAHHGSRFTTGKQFLSKTRPKLAVISVGNNNYGHPSDELIERTENLDIQTMRTDVDGCVLVSVGSNGIFASGYNSSE